LLLAAFPLSLFKLTGSHWTACKCQGRHDGFRSLADYPEDTVTVLEGSMTRVSIDASNGAALQVTVDVENAFEIAGDDLA